MHDAPDYVLNRCRSAVMGDTRACDIRHKSGVGMARYLNHSDSHFDLCFTPSLPPSPMRSIRLARPAFVNPLQDLLCRVSSVFRIELRGQVSFFGGNMQQKNLGWKWTLALGFLCVVIPQRAAAQRTSTPEEPCANCVSKLSERNPRSHRERQSKSLRGRGVRPLGECALGDCKSRPIRERRP